MNRTILIINLIRLFWWLFKCLFITWFTLKFIRILWVFVLWLLLCLYLMLLECILIWRWPLKLYFWFTIYVVLCCCCICSSLFNKISILFRLETWFVAAFTLEFCSTWFVLIYWLLFYNDRLWFVAVFVGGVGVEWDVGLIF